MITNEQDCRRLNAALDSKTAEDSELIDFHENIHLQSGFIIEGLTNTPEGMSPEDWQEKVMVEVPAVLTILIGCELPILFTQNNTGRGRVLRPNTTFRLNTLRIQRRSGTSSAFSSFTVTATSRNCNQESNKGSRFQVISHEPRPVLKLHPASSAEERRVQTHCFIQAIRSVMTNFTDNEINFILQRVSTKLHGQFCVLFVVIRNDMTKK